MKTLYISTLFCFLCLSIAAQEAGELNLDFGENGIYMQDWDDTSAHAYAIGVLSDGNLIVAGNYSTSLAGEQIYVQKLDKQGNSLSFGNFSRGFWYGFTDFEGAYSVYILPDNKILIAGDYYYEGEDYPFVIRLLSNGQLDDEFGINGVFTDNLNSQDVKIIDILQMEDSYSIILGGRNNDYYPQLLMVDDQGKLQTTFGTGGIVEVDALNCKCRDLVIDNVNNDLYVCGSDLSNTKSFIAKYNLPTGIPDTDFGVDGIINVVDDTIAIYEIVFTSEDNTLAAFGAYKNSGDYDIFAYRVDAIHGNADASFGIGGWSTLRSPNSGDFIHSVIQQSDGKYYFGGYSNFNVTDDDDFMVGRLNYNGTLDNTFGTGGGIVLTDIEYSREDHLQDIALSPAEDILYAAGYFFAPDKRISTVVAYCTGYESEPPIGTVNFRSNAITCFPNPSTDYVTIETGKSGPHQLQVFDLTGNKLINKSFTEDKLELNLEMLQPSVYFVRVTLPDGQAITSKLVKK